MSKYFAISDTHFGHEKIISLCGRPFANKSEMDEALINNWNSVVGSDDVVFHLGDYSWYKEDNGIFDRLNGEKVLILGNHDNPWVMKLDWEDVVPYMETKILGKNFVFMHYPIHSWNNQFKGAIHLHGHIHNNFFPTDVMKNRHNVSVEAINYTPVDISTYI